MIWITIFRIKHNTIENLHCTLPTKSFLYSQSRTIQLQQYNFHTKSRIDNIVRIIHLQLKLIRVLIYQVHVQPQHLQRSSPWPGRMARARAGGSHASVPPAARTPRTRSTWRPRSCTPYRLSLKIHSSLRITYDFTHILVHR